MKFEIKRTWCVILGLVLGKWLKNHSWEVWGGVLLLAAFFFTHRFFFLPGDWRTHDGVHFIRLYDLDRVLKEGQFPPRWLPDLGKGYGYPFFNFYPPLPYWIGEIFHLLGFSLVDSCKLSFAAAGFLGMVGIFFLVKKFFGEKAAFLAAFFWLFLPFRALDLYVRGSLAEYWGMSLLPWVFYFLTVFLQKQSLNHFLSLAFSLALLFLSHNIISLIGGFWIGVFLIYYLLFLIKGNKERFLLFLKFAGAFLLALGMAAFFVFPALLEKKFTQVGTMTSGYFAYYNHFPSLFQLFLSRFWGYGGSNFGPQDGMSFQIGYLQWLLPIFSLFILLKWSLGRSKKDFPFFMGIFFVFSFGFFVFLSHQRSLFIWKKISFLKFLQFPWRLLIFIDLAAVVASGFLIKFIQNRWPKKLFLGFLLILIIFTMGLNYSFFRPREVVQKSDNDYLSSTDFWHYLQREFLFDYLPRSVKKVPENYYRPPLVLDEDGLVEIEEQKAHRLAFRVRQRQAGEAVVKIFYFPGWQAKINGRKADIKTNENGLMVLNLEKGENRVEILLKDTPVRKAADIISLFSWLLFIFLIIKRKRYNNFKKWKK